ncbi:MAG: hypothetical protein J6P05_03135 [Lachnospiraceae bacterium]|nr:hypothetical protein [Lachnospiraceae bacterium]
MIPVIDATDVRKEWVTIVDSVVRAKPQFFKLTRDYCFLSDFLFMEELLKGYSFTANQMMEEDGSVTLALNEIDLVENGKDEKDARMKLAASILEYSEDYYKDFTYWGSAPNRRVHIPYVFKALFIGDIQKIGENIQCQAGKI